MDKHFAISLLGVCAFILPTMQSPCTVIDHAVDPQIHHTAAIREYCEPDMVMGPLRSGHKSVGLLTDGHLR